MAESRVGQFSALDEQLEAAVRSASTTSRTSSTPVTVGGGEPVDLPMASLKKLALRACGLLHFWGDDGGQAAAVDTAIGELG